jgi:hypothetical protein
MTTNVDRDPKLYDNEIESFEDFHNLTLNVVDQVDHFNYYGEYQSRMVATHHQVEEKEYFDTFEYNDFDNLVDELIDSVHPQPATDTYAVTPTNVDQKPNFDLLRPLFGGALVDTLKRT